MTDAIVELIQLSVNELADGYRRRDFSPTQVVTAIAARMGEEQSFNAVVEELVESALVQAADVERALLHGEQVGPLAGIPVLVKDIVDVAGTPTTCGSAATGTAPAPTDATVVRRLREAGAVMIGKSHSYEFAWGITSENEFHGDCRNPWDPARTSGGSSSGSAAGVALGLAPLAVGTDTAGSIRIPAAFCGVAGLRPTLGRISTTGVFPLSRSFDSVGLITRVPGDAMIALQAVCGPDRSDVLTGLVPPLLEANVTPDSLRGLRVGVAVLPQAIAPTPGISGVLDAAYAQLELLGASVTYVELPPADLMLHSFAPIQSAEAHDVHIRSGLYPRQADRYSSAVRRRLERGGSVSLADYLTASERRREVHAAMWRLLADVDVIVSPVSPVAPPMLVSDDDGGRAGDVFRSEVLPYTVAQVLASLPACSVPVGTDDLGLPVGLQITGAPGADLQILAVGQMVHQPTWPPPH